MRGIITRASNIELGNSFTSFDELTGSEEALCLYLEL